MKKWQKWCLGLVSILVLLIGSGLAGASLYLFNYAFVPGEKTFLSAHRVTADQRWLAQTTKQTWYEESATDHLKLVADYVPAAHATKKTIVVAHGYMDTKERMASYIRLYHRLGYNVLAPDDRASGESQGRYITFGWLDRLDYVKWVKQIIRRNGKQSQIGLFGVSMGGAMVMMMSGEKLPSQVKAIIEDCGYTSIKTELGYQLKELFNLPEFPLLYTAALVGRIKLGFNFLKASALTQLKKNKLPIFFIHGAKDTFVPTWMVKENYRATHAPKQLWIVPKAKHAGSFQMDPATYAEKTGAFFARYLH